MGLSLGRRKSLIALDGFTTVTARLGELAFLLVALLLVIGTDLPEFLFLLSMAANLRTLLVNSAGNRQRVWRTTVVGIQSDRGRLSLCWVSCN